MTDDASRPDPCAAGPPSDEALVRGHLSGDAVSFRALIERYHDPLLGFLVRFMGGDKQAAEDVFQDTFLQIHQSLGTFDQSKRFKPWLFTIASNKARDALRRTKRRPAHSLDARMGAAAEGPSYVDLLSIDLPPASTHAEAEERSKVVQRAIDLLSETQREVLLMAYFQELSYQQLAETLGVPLGTIKSRLHSAVAAFGKRYQELTAQRDADGESRSAAG